VHVYVLSNAPPCAGFIVADIAADAAMWISNGATVTLVECSFIHNKVTNPHYITSVLSVNAVNPSYPHAQLQDTVVRMQRCTFSGNSAQRMLMTYSGVQPYTSHSAFIYSDDASLDVTRVLDDVESVTRGAPEPLSAAPAGRPGINSTSTWLQRVQQVCT
jgi:hypothetical protein